MMNCKEATKASIKRTEGSISISERFQLWMHLIMCKYCSLFAKQQAWLNKSLAKRSESELGFTIEEKEALNQNLKKI